MSKPFSMLAAVVLLVVAAAHAYRLFAALDITIAGHIVPLWVSWPGAIVAAVLGIMTLAESRR